MLADSHCHLDCLDLEKYGQDVCQAIAAARKKNVRYILCPGVSIEAFSNIFKIISVDQDLFASVGVHPTEKNVYQPKLQDLLTSGEHKKVVAIGETGLDFYYGNDEVERQRQRELFGLHLQAARELGKPLIIHARDADQEIVKILTEEHAEEIGGVLHCFTGSLEMAQASIALGFYISFSGIVTFRNAESLRQVAKKVPLEKILLETDAPYLAPNPVRGKSNEPANLPYIAEFMAELLGVSYEEFAAQTTANFLQFCRL